MLALSRTAPLLIGTLFFFGILTYSWPTSSPFLLFRQAEMASLPQPFTIHIGGKPIAPVDADAENNVHAQLGSEPATFKLQDGRLVSGDWILGRNLTEDRSMMPKKISWFKDGSEPAKHLHAVTAYEEGGEKKLKLGGATLVADEGRVFVDLFGGEEAVAALQLQFKE